MPRVNCLGSGIQGRLHKELSVGEWVNYIAPDAAYADRLVCVREVTGKGVSERIAVSGM